MPNANPSVQPKIQTFEFHLKRGDESVTPPHGWSNPDKVWLVDIRRRRYFLGRISVEFFTEMAQQARTSTDETLPHVLGMPIYYCIRQGVMWLWPVPAHNWSGGMSKGEL